MENIKNLKEKKEEKLNCAIEAIYSRNLSAASELINEVIVSNRTEDITYNLKVKNDVLYLCGAITSDPQYKEKFNRNEKLLKKAGYAVINPIALPHEDIQNWSRTMRLDIIVMLRECSGIALLGDWSMSIGASLEVKIANDLGILTRSVKGWISEKSACAG